MRGKGFQAFPSTSKYRITPAYAGKRPVVAAVLNRVRDHPRLCGEKTHTAHAKGFYKGSPPPMRGKAFVYFTKNVVCRITPAYAGKS